jgi:uncharacterized protein YyaL (SSP411 family)
VKTAKSSLKETRERRPRPIRDEKILVAWNGLMISAFARAGLILGDSRYTRSAENAADFIINRMLVDGRLYRSYKEEQARHNAYLDDYAFFIAALLDLYEVTRDFKWFAMALELEQVLARHYEDPEEGGFFMTSDDHEKLIAREKPNYDGALPSGNAIAVMNLLRLGEFTSDSRYTTRAEKALTSLSGVLASNPSALAGLLLALDFYLDQPKEIVIVVPRGQKELADPFLEKLRGHFLPNRIIAVFDEGDDRKALEAAMPITRHRPTEDGRATAYVCQSNTCKLPTTDPAEFERQIGG